MERGGQQLRIAYVLLTADKPLTVKEIQRKTGCDRKTVPSVIDAMEISGFVTEVNKKRIGNKNYNCYSAKLQMD